MAKKIIPTSAQLKLPFDDIGGALKQSINITTESIKQTAKIVNENRREVLFLVLAQVAFYLIQNFIDRKYKK